MNKCFEGVLEKTVFMCPGLIDTAVTKEFVKATWSVAWHRATPNHWKQRAGKMFRHTALEEACWFQRTL